MKYGYVATLWRSFFDLSCYHNVATQWRIKNIVFYLFLIFVIHILWLASIQLFSRPNNPYLFEHILLKIILTIAPRYIIIGLLCLFYACLVMLFGAFFKLHFNYRVSFRLSIVSMTPYLFLHMIALSIIDHYRLSLTNVFGLIEVLVQLGYLFFAAYAYKQEGKPL